MVDRRTIRYTRGGGVRKGSRATRIRIPQPTRRPIKVKGAPIRGELIKEDPWWFVTHRRGVRRPTVGLDPLEARAVSERAVRGYLHERIVYRWLTANGFRSGADFDFQSSMFGGRLELGGIVADFLFPYMRIILSVEGPLHRTQLRKAKDTEQRQLLAELGYEYHGISTKTIERQAEFEQMMRRIFFDRSTMPMEEQRIDIEDMTNEMYEADVIDSAILDLEVALG